MHTRFRTYATYFIKGEIKHYLRDKAAMIKAPRELQELVFKITSTAKKLTEEGMEVRAIVPSIYAQMAKKYMIS